MNRRPYMLAIALAISTVAGFIGMMVVDGYWDILFLIIALLPLTSGFAAWWCRWVD